jgi:hypothetical protein
VRELNIASRLKKAQIVCTVWRQILKFARTEHGREKIDASFQRRLRWIILFWVWPVKAYPEQHSSTSLLDSDPTAVGLAITQDPIQMKNAVHGIVVNHSALLSPLAILISGVIAWTIANKTIKANRIISKKRATFEYVSDLQWDDDYIDFLRKYVKLKAGKMKIRLVAEEYHQLRRNEKRDDDEFNKVIEQHSAIVGLLNAYETIAVGIFTDTLDEEIIRRNMRQTIIDVVDTCSEFISVTRKQIDNAEDPKKIYDECERLAKKWKSHETFR